MMYCESAFVSVVVIRMLHSRDEFHCVAGMHDADLAVPVVACMPTSMVCLLLESLSMVCVRMVVTRAADGESI